MEKFISGLDDATALDVLRRLAAGGDGQDMDASEAEAKLAAWAGSAAAGEAAGSVSEGDIARAALLVAAEDGDRAEIIRALATGPRAEALGVGTAIAVSVAVLLVLESHIEFKRNADGTWEFSYIKKPTDGSVLKGLLSKVWGFLS